MGLKGDQRAEIGPFLRLVAASDKIEKGRPPQGAVSLGKTDGKKPGLILRRDHVGSKLYEKITER